MQSRPTGALWRALIATCAAVVGLSAAIADVSPASAAGFDTGFAEARLVTAINRDRAENGLSPLTLSPALSNIARGGSFSVCGVAVHGRSQDMIERGYFSHPIPPCGTMVFPALAGMRLSAAGENIGWNNVSPETASVDRLNAGFMGSPEHRANILGNYNEVGVGAYAAPGSWAYGGQRYSGVVMYTEIFGLGPLPAAPPARLPAPRRVTIPAPAPASAPAAVVAPAAVAAPVPVALTPAALVVDPERHARYCATLLPTCSEQWLESLGPDRAYYLRGPVELRLAALADALGLIRPSGR